MQKASAKLYTQTRTAEGILATLAFFHLYRLPLTAERIHELLYRAPAGREEVDSELARLAKLDLVVARNGLYALADWSDKDYANNQAAIAKRWNRIKKYYWLLSAVPFVRHMAVINSVAMGSADGESDIDFFVVCKPNRLYFVRTWIILLFKLLGVYKSRRRINEQFCFGFFVSEDALSIKHLALPEEDPYLAFWLGTLTPITGEQVYERFLKENRWVYSWLPNFRTINRIGRLKELRPRAFPRRLLEILLDWPAAWLEPLLRRVHIRHTMKLPENSWKTSTTVADRRMLKLHALDPRRDLRRRFWETLRQYR